MKKFLAGITGFSFLCAGGSAVFAQQARPSQAPASSGQTCLQIDRVDSWNIVNQSTMVVTDKTHNKYRVTLNGNCAYSHFYDKVIFRPFSSEPIGCVAKGDRVNLSNRVGDVQRCYITSVSRYTDAQMDIDLRAARSRP